MNLIQNLLRQRMGLHSATVGSSLIERAVLLRMRSHHLTRQEDYFKLLKQSSVEWNSLVESVVVTETWFFRDKQPFLALAQLVQTEWLPAHATGPLRLLSVPCSSGEEPYSIAMSLLDAGIPHERFQIDAVDISARALDSALRGMFGKNSFRGHDLSFRNRYFQTSKEGYLLTSAVRKSVHFHRGNLLETDCLNEAGTYDFIFCRNLLIYFDGPTQQKAMHKLHRLFKPAGVLFVAPAESSLALANGFASANLPFSFAFRLAALPKRRVEQIPRPLRSTLKRAKLRFAVPLAGASARKPRSNPTLHSPAIKQVTAPASLAVARRLTNEGRLAEAAELCETHLREQGVSAEAYFLLGLVRDAA
ncbi:MAG: cheR methyltransferase, binding domain protein, partial [Pedosphaera sp.]|nr:cheR methyltransferase, binding domain protein [Pedosphaera sp.]